MREEQYIKFSLKNFSSMQYLICLAVHLYLEYSFRILFLLKNTMLLFVESNKSVQHLRGFSSTHWNSTVVFSKTCWTPSCKTVSGIMHDVPTSTIKSHGCDTYISKTIWLLLTGILLLCDVYQQKIQLLSVLQTNCK